jgi:hypothetical protein
LFRSVGRIGANKLRVINAVVLGVKFGIFYRFGYDFNTDYILADFAIERPIVPAPQYRSIIFLPSGLTYSFAFS